LCTYSGNNLINLLYPIIDNNIYQIIINNSIITDAHNISNNTFSTNQYFENKMKDVNYDSKNINVNKNNYNNDKFNYLGILSIDATNNIIFDDQYSTNNGQTRYIRSEDNNIYTITFDSTQNRYKINDISNGIIVNPVEIINIVPNNTVFNISNEISLISSLQPNQQLMYIYIYDVTFESTPILDVITEIVLYINNLTFVCSIRKIDELTFTFIIVTNIIIEFPTDKLVYVNNSVWLISPKITNINIIKQQNIIYSIQSDSSTNSYLSNSNSNFIYGSVNKLYNKTDLYMLLNNNIISNNYNGPYNTLVSIIVYGFVHLDNKSEFLNNTSTGFKINLYKYENNEFKTVILPTMIIKDNYIYSYASYNKNIQSILTISPMNYILLTDLNNKNRYMLQLNNISLIPHCNYQTFIYPQDYLNLIIYNIPLTIDDKGNVINIQESYNLPNYSYYLVTFNKISCIYYYETGTSMLSNGSSYYTIKNVNINSIFLIDNSLFNSNMAQLINSYLKFNVYDNYINKNLVINKSSYNFDTFDNLYFKSTYSNGLYQISSYNNNNFNYINSDTYISLLLSNNTITAYYPIAISQINITDKPYISYNPYINNSNIVVNSSILILDINNISFVGTSYIVIGNIITTGESINDYFSSISNKIIISNNQILLLVRFDTNYPDLVPFNILPPNNVVNNVIENDNLLQLILWELIGTRSDGTSYDLYFWTYFGSSIYTVKSNNSKIISTPLDFKNTRDFYINIETSFLSQPTYITIDTNITINSNYTLITSSPEIVKQNNTKLFLIYNNQNVDINYKYFTDIRQSEISKYSFNINPLNFKSIDNIKPKVESFINNNIDPKLIDLSSINSNVNYYILVYLSVSANTQVIKVYYANILDQINFNVLKSFMFYNECSFAKIKRSLSYWIWGLYYKID
jgi:hypothetical protein